MQPSNAFSAANQPLCLNQEQLLLSREWLEQGSRPGSPSLSPTILSLQGPLNADALERALNQVVQRHAALRARFCHAPEAFPGEQSVKLREFGSGVYLPGSYRQRVEASAVVVLRRAAEQLTPQEWIREEAEHCFGLDETPRVRASLLSRGAEDHLLLILADHAVTDAWSMRVFRRELVSLYDHFCGGAAQVLPDAGISYPEYAEWQHRAIESGEFQAAVSYWSRQWERYGRYRVAYDDLAFAQPAQGPELNRFGSEQAAVAPGVCEAIRTFARLSRLSLNMFFFASYAAVLHSHTRKPRLALWCHFANRTRPEAQNSIGYFVHRHLIGLDFPEGLTGSELLWEARRAILDGYEHQHAPLAHVWRSMNRWPRYADCRALADYHHADEAWEDWELAGGLRIRRVEPPAAMVPRFSSLGFYVRDSREGMTLEIQYNQGRFTPASIRGLLQDLQSVAGHLLSHPDDKLKDFVLRPPDALAFGRDSKMGEFVGLNAGRETVLIELECDQ